MVTQLGDESSENTFRTALRTGRRGGGRLGGLQNEYAPPMRRSRFLLLGLLPAAPLFAAACSETPVNLGLVMVAPQAIGDADSVELFVFPADSGKCNADGSVSSTPKDAAHFPLSKKGCAEGLSWCADIELTRSDDKQTFHAVAKQQGQETLQGCTSVAVDQDPLQVTIEMKQVIVPKCCGDAKLQVGEQCDSGGSATCGGVAQDEVCFPDCTATEVLLSIDDTLKPFLANTPHSKSELAMAFCPGNAQTGTALRTVFTSADDKANNKSDINLRALSPELLTITDPVPLSQQMRLPMTCANPTGPGGKGAEHSPAIAPVSSTSTLIVYASNEKLQSSSDIFLIEHSEDVCADVGLDTEPATLVSITAAAPGAITPDVAGGPEGTALIVWKQGDQIVSRLWKTGALEPAADQPPTPIATGSNPKVAGSASGWVVVYEGAGAGDGDGVFKRVIGLDGKPGAEVLVNGDTGGPQVQPDVAMTAGGACAVVWQSNGDIFAQRYGADGVAVKGDQDAPLNGDNPGVQGMPAIGAPLTGGGFFAAAWENEDGTISARFLGESNGFLFNSVDGTSASFLASHPGITGTRHRPAVAVSGYVAIGWQDDSDGHPGVFVRRFPVPK